MVRLWKWSVICICIGAPYCYGCSHSRCDSKPESTRGFPAFVIPAAWSTPKYRVFLLSVQLYFRSVLPHSLNLCCLTAWFSCCLTAWIYAASQLDANPDSYLSYWLLRQKPDMCFGIIVSRHCFLRYWFSGVGRIFVLNSVGYLHQWIGCSGGDRISSWISLSTSTLHLSAHAQMQFQFDPSFFQLQLDDPAFVRSCPNAVPQRRCGFQFWFSVNGGILFWVEL